MKLLGATLKGTTEEIKLAECPAVIDIDEVACLGRPGSSIFRRDSIVYKAEEADVVEGDYVFEDGVFLGIAYYSRGWKIHCDKCEPKELIITEHIKMKSSQRDYEVFKAVNEIPERIGVLVYANEVESPLFDMVTIKGNEIVFSGQNKRAYCDEVFLSTGFYSKQKVAYYFGQYVKGGVLSLNKYLEFVVRTQIQEIKIKMEEL